MCASLVADSNCFFKSRSVSSNTTWLVHTWITLPPLLHRIWLSGDQHMLVMLAKGNVNVHSLHIHPCMYGYLHDSRALFQGGHLLNSRTSIHSFVLPQQLWVHQVRLLSGTVPSLVDHVITTTLALPFCDKQLNNNSNQNRLIIKQKDSS